MKIFDQIRPACLDPKIAPSFALALGLVLLPLAAWAQSSAYTTDAPASGLTFSFTPGAAAPLQQSVTVSSTTGSSLQFVAVAAVSTPAGGNWLSLAAFSTDTGSKSVQANTPWLLYMRADPTGLAAGTYQGQVRFGPDAATASTNPSLTIAVTLTSQGSQAGQLSVSATQLNFSFQTGGSTPAQQNLTLTNNTTVTLDYSVTPNITSGPVGWLNVSAASANLSGGSSVQIPVQINTASLTTGTYQGSITIRSNTATNSPITVSVTLFVNTSATAQLGVAPLLLAFTYQTGAAAPAQQFLTLSNNTTASLTYSVSATSTPAGWLSASTQPGTLTSGGTLLVPVSIVTTGLTTGSYSGAVTITSNAANSPISIPVTLAVNVLGVFPGQLGFLYQTGSPAPTPQALWITNPVNTSPPPQLAYTVAVTDLTGGATWLSVAPQSGNTPGSVLAIVDPTNLAAGTYTANVALTSQSTATTQKIPVTLTVSTTPLLSATPATLQFVSQQSTAATAAQSIQVGSTGGTASPLSFTVSASSVTGSWLSATANQASTPAIITVTANPTNLTAGTYYGSVTITGQGAGNAITIPVAFTVSQFTLLSSAPTALAFAAPLSGAAPGSQALTISSTGTTILYSVSTISAPSAWLTVDRTGGSTADTTATVKVTVSQTGLPQGVYYGQITIAAYSVPNSPLVIPVVMTVANTATIVPQPVQLSFTQYQNSTAPPAQVISVTSSGAALNLTVTTPTATGGTWLTATPLNGATPLQISVSVNAGTLRPDTYSGTVILSAPNAINSPVAVPVTLTVTQPVTITVNPVSLTASATLGSSPANQSIAVTSSGLVVSFTAAATTNGGGNWLSATVPNGGGATPGSVTVSYSTASLTPGSYSGTVAITPTGLPAINVPVSLTITDLPKPQILKVQNAASFAYGAIAPGEFIYFEGTNLGPATMAGLQLTSTGMVDTKVAGTRVLFDGVPAPIYYVQASKASVVVPYEILGRLSTNIQVELNGRLSDPIQQAVAAAAPGIFTVNAQGSGQGAILNQDYSYNTPAHPASRGEVISIYATGEGQTNPQVLTGSVTGSNPAKPYLQPVTVRIGGILATVTYAGAAPALVAGVLQVNAKIPDGVPIGYATLELWVGGYPAQSGVTVSVR